MDTSTEAVRAFAMMTAKIASILQCPYEDAAVFLMKLGPVLTLMQDKDFAEKFTRYCAGVQATTAPGPREIQ